MLVDVKHNIVIELTFKKGNSSCLMTGHATVFEFWGPGPLNSTGRHGPFLKWTCDMEPSDMRNKTKTCI